MEQSPSQIRNGELSKWREQVIRDLRAFADALEATTNEQFPTPYVSFSLYSIEVPTDDDPYACRNLTFDDARLAMAALPGKWRKTVNDNGLYYAKQFGETCRVYLNIDRSATCERVQVGTKHVEATEAHDEPVYEWRCNDIGPEVTNA